MKKTLLLGLTFIGFSALASQPQQLSVGYSITDINTDNNLTYAQLSDTASGDYRLGYDYGFADNWSVSIGYITGDSDQFDLIFDELTDSKMDYFAWTLGVKGELPLSEHNLLYGSLFVDRYDLKMKDGGHEFFSDTGTKLGLSAGWQYRWHSGFSVGLGYSYLPMGSEITLNSIDFKLAYQF